MPHRSRRLTRARQLGLPLAYVGADVQRFRPTTPPAAKPDEATRCCVVTSTRHVSSGGTVFLLHQHASGCPAWTVP